MMPGRLPFGDAQFRQALARRLAAAPLVDGAQPQAEKVCEAFFRLCEETIRRVGSFYLLRAGQWDDFIQDAWLAILSALEQGRWNARRGRLEDWLFVVVRNRAITLFRRQCRAENGLVDLPLDAMACSPAEDPSVRFDRVCNIESIQAALTLLEQRTSPVTYSVFFLRQLRELSVDDVAQRLGLTCGQVRVYDHRARRKLADILVRRGFA